MTKADDMIALIRKVIADASQHEDSKTPNKLTTNAVTKRTGLTARTVRFYSEQGIATPIRRATVRLFTPSQVRRLELARDLRSIGMDVKSVVKTLNSLVQPGQQTATLSALADRLAGHAEELQLRQEQLQGQFALTSTLVKQLQH